MSESVGATVSATTRSVTSSRWAVGSSSSTHGRSESTIRAYRSDLRQFARWLAGFKEHEPHDPEDLARIKTAPRTAKEVADFLAAKSQSEISPGVRRYAPSTVTRYLAAINWEHARLHYDPPGNHPRVRDTLKGIRRDDPPPIDRAAPLTLKPLTSSPPPGSFVSRTMSSASSPVTARMPASKLTV